LVQNLLKENFALNFAYTEMVKALLVVGLLIHATTNLKMGTNVRNFISSRPPGKQTVSIDQKPGKYKDKSLTIIGSYRGSPFQYI
jgi:hypothetical protein